ncbi:MAG TPA: hypothetical protein DCZ94_17150 [Lentisphaeria bacterium]|nr:MAG: hypothetical protein A2X48_21030 [Lentisphaerae bacterium GWF2_49_21]HBC88673.1 hypothetical protein [Lentisphaeria bacterium]
MSLALVFLAVFLPDVTSQEKKSSGKRIFDWEKEGDAEGWTPITFESEKKNYPFIKAVAQSDRKANTGKGSLEISIESSTEKFEAAGRAEKSFYAKPEDWSGYKKLTAKFYLTQHSTYLEAYLAVQTGDKWNWYQGKSVEGKEEAWTEVSLDISESKDLDKVVAIHFILKSRISGFTEKVYLDNVELHESP